MDFSHDQPAETPPPVYEDLPFRFLDKWADVKLAHPPEAAGIFCGNHGVFMAICSEMAKRSHIKGVDVSRGVIRFNKIALDSIVRVRVFCNTHGAAGDRETVSRGVLVQQTDITRQRYSEYTYRVDGTTGDCKGTPRSWFKQIPLDVLLSFKIEDALRDAGVEDAHKMAMAGLNDHKVAEWARDNGIYERYPSVDEVKGLCGYLFHQALGARAIANQE